MAFPCYSAQFPLKVTEGHSQKKKKKFYGISDWTNGKCVLYIHLLYSDLGLNLESYMGLGGFSVLFLYKITSLQTGQEEMKETDIL